jgi:hypothetical protein
MTRSEERTAVKPTVKKSNKRLDKEIAEALHKRDVRTHLPSLRVTKIRPEFIDEWYGVHADFQWTEPFDLEAYRDATRAEEHAWFKANPHKMHAGLFSLEKTMGDHIRREIAHSPQWTAFFSKPQKVSRFGEKDIDNWEFDALGGWASASDRD